MTTLTDKYGRLISVSQANGRDIYSVAGAEFSFTAGWPQEQALSTIEGMSPEIVQSTVLSCSDLQFRLSLNQMGLRAAVDSYVAGASQDVRDWWDRATTIHSNNPMLIDAATALGKTQADIDAVIALGQTLT